MSPGQNGTGLGRGIEGHSRAAQEFSSAAASSSPIIVNPAGTNLGSIVNGGSERSDLPFVSQIVFSNNFQYVACLVSGSINRVAIYECKPGGKTKLVAAENFAMNCYTEEETLSPVAGE